MKCIPEVSSWKIPEEERAKRYDFTRESVFTIDCPGATVLDDAVHCKKISEGEPIPLLFNLLKTILRSKL